MLLDARSISDNETITTDVCIVGAGVAGLTLAKEFKQAKFKTCIIESGGEKPNKSTQSLYWGKNVGLPYYPLDTARARFLGGSSHYWVIKLPERGMGVRLRPFDPIDFERKEWVPYSGWPFSKKHLDPYYERAQAICQIGPYDYTPHSWAEPHQKPLPFIGDKVYTTLFQFGLRDVFFKQYTDEIKATENITILLHGNVVEVETNETASEVTRLSVACLEGNRFKVSAKMYILAMGGLEVPRLLLLSNRVQPAGLGNSHDLVGRFFMEHPHLWTGQFVPSSLMVANNTHLYDIFRNSSVPAMGKIALSDSTLKKEKLLNWVTSIHPDYQLSHQHYMGHDTPGVKAYRNIKNTMKNGHFNVRPKDISAMVADRGNLFRLTHRKILGHLGGSFRREKHITVFRLNPMMEQAPNPESRVFLDIEKDALGQARINLDWQLTPLDTYTITRAQEILDEECRLAGLGHLVIETRKDRVPKGIHGGWHHMGTTRMHIDSKQGVVDPNCQVHGISNLYIGGASTFPTSGYANPVLTTIAIVLRLADHIRKKIGE